MKLLVIPDVHQNIDWVKSIFEREPVDDFDKIIFLGDYTDSHKKNGIASMENTMLYFDELCDKYGDKIVLLIGNHDAAYIMNSMSTPSGSYTPRRNQIYSWYCSGYNNSKATDFHKVCKMYPAREGKQSLMDKFRFHFEVDGILFTHAGLTKSMAGEFGGIENTLKFMNSFSDISEIFYANPVIHLYSAVGYARGGHYSHGGIIWEDMFSFVPTPGIIQVFGHTAHDNSASIFFEGKDMAALCIDGGQQVYAVIDTTEKIYKIKTTTKYVKDVSNQLAIHKICDGQSGDSIYTNEDVITIA